jgi:Ca2+-binding RTX toxin-like protein
VVWLDVQGEDAAGAETHSEVYVVGVRGPQGTDGNDRLFGIDGQNAICAGAGDDYVYLSERGVDSKQSWVFGEGGNDQLSGGGEDVHLYGGEGNDTIYGWGGDDYLVGGTGNDVLVGGHGVDTLIGGSGNDILVRADSDGADELFGGDGDDRLVGSYAGEGYLTGGSGQDTFVVYHEYHASSRDAVLDFATGPGGDVLDYHEYLGWYGFPNDVNPFSAGFMKFENSGDGGYALVAYPDSRGPVTNIVLFGVDPASIIPENLFPAFDPWAIAQDQVIVGTDGFDDLHGDGGNDTIVGLGGDDLLYGWLGDDVLQGGPGSDVLSGGEGNDILEGGADDDILYGDRGGDLFRFEGAFGSDIIGDFGFSDHISIGTDLAADFPSLDTNGNGVLDDSDASVAVTAFETVITFDTGSIHVDTQTQLEADDFVFT